MKKRMLSLLLAAAITGSLLYGCGNKTSNSTKTAPNDDALNIENREYKDVHITFLNRMD